LSHFTEEQAEVRLVAAGAAGEFGIGSRHLHDSLKRLAILDPRFTESADPSGEMARLGELIRARKTAIPTSSRLRT
jgi:hypothetical protein